MKNEKAFTLVEMLIVLIIIMILTILIVPNMFKMIEKYETTTFLKQLNSDILYIQNETMSQAREHRIVLKSDQQYYYIINIENKIVKKEKIPEGISYSNIQTTIKFNARGSVFNPRTIYFKDKYASYKLVLPLGKGRHYIEER
ncbi:MAG TPA: competence type IV pilus minor pilin ComGD [Pseudogracilibacillus sp.]|nr:competence type IV pilus minor pilin ComGD [Pseudogracilibacillus sp.]